MGYTKEIFEYIEKFDAEQVIFCRDKSSDLKAIIVLHDSTLGPATGGTRAWYYEKEEDALIDCFRLAKGMTYKYAAAGINLGGGKAVILLKRGQKPTEAMLRALGRYVETLGGRFITGEDVGLTVGDLEYINMETDYVVGLPREYGGSGGPSPYTALGVVEGMKVCCEEIFKNSSLNGRIVAVQGVGNVGYNVVKLLHNEGAKVIVTDVNEERIKRVAEEFGVDSVSPDEIYDIDCDIFSPCALGGILNDDTVPRLKCKIVAGSANNQLLEPRHGDLLHQKGILYAPDYIINAGGTIADTDELEDGFNAKRAQKKVKRVAENLKFVFKISKERNIPTYKAADIFAEERIKSIGMIKKIKVKPPKKLARAEM